MINYKLLRCVKCNTRSLKISDSKAELVCSVCNQIYPVQNDVPILFQPDEEPEIFQSEIHKKQGTEFKYKEHYQQDALDFDYFQEREKGTEHSERRVREFIFSQAPKNPNRILDVGCGNAWVAELFCSSANEVISMDISHTNVGKALEKYPYKNHSGVVADVLNLPFRENSFDCIIASEIIEHVVHPNHFVENLIRILKPGGVLLVTTPYKEKLQYNLCIHCNKLTPRHAHIHSFDENKLAGLYAEKDTSFEYKTFANKALIHLRTHVVLHFLPFGFWRFIDKVANAIYKAPATIFVKWERVK
ncbi:methyltransferase domain-containing protein [Prolixibacteraceae bacterium Z1-6]|uniref:Methyltransferase domain-containing protein n=1 Tax=Draconibacterium aestuarii TaxID=2998507 RepID=A0A9X3J6J0_9BACT|nr:methyltransferase domain-containing protein [Prolixibacteraceae bacterium Z1-6]